MKRKAITAMDDLAKTRSAQGQQTNSDITRILHKHQEKEGKNGAGSSGGNHHCEASIEEMDTLFTKYNNIGKKADAIKKQYLPSPVQKTFDKAFEAFEECHKTFLNNENTAEFSEAINNFSDTCDSALKVIKEIAEFEGLFFGSAENFDNNIERVSTFYKSKGGETVMDIIKNSHTIKGRVDEIKAQIISTRIIAIGDKSAIDGLFKIASDKENYALSVRGHAVRAIGILGDMSAVDGLFKIASDKENYALSVREHAIGAIEFLGDMSSKERLTSMLHSRKFSDLEKTIHYTLEHITCRLRTA